MVIERLVVAVAMSFCKWALCFVKERKGGGGNGEREEEDDEKSSL